MEAWRTFGGLEWTCLICAFVATLLIATEMIARIWVRRGGEYYVYRPGRRLRSYTDRIALPSQSEVVRFEVNSQGERGDEVPKDLSRTYRILVTGGSATECYYLDQPVTWPEVVKRELATPGRLAQLGVDHVHVGSIGRSLFTAETLDDVLAKIGPRYTKLDVLVVMVGVSNVFKWLMKRTPASIEEMEPIAPRVFDVDPRSRFGWRPRKTALADLFRRFRSKSLRVVETHRGAGAWLSKARRLRHDASRILTETPDPAVMVDHFERRLRALLARAHAMAARVVVVRQPWFRKVRYDRAELETFWHGAAFEPAAETRDTFYSVETVSRLVEILDDRASKVVNDLGAEQVDLQPVLEPSLSHFYDFFHLTPAGALTVGKAVADAIWAGAIAPLQERPFEDGSLLPSTRRAGSP